MQAEKIPFLHQTSRIELQSGMIESVTEQVYRVTVDAGCLDATRAFSCMVEPMVNDTVLFSINSNGQCHILAIIDRIDCADTHLAFPGDVALSARQGELSLNGRQGVNLTSDQHVRLATEEVTIIAGRALFGVESLTAVGSKLVSKISNVQTIADSVETVAVNLLQKLKNSFRVIEGVDQSRSRDVLTTVKNLYSMRSTQAAILAKKDIKVDAERIHMG